MQRQYAWLELYKGMWHLLTDIKSESLDASRKWADKDVAISELIEDGWTVAGKYPNWLSDKLNLGNKFHGYGLIRTIH
jgi:hypothetical protein